MRKLAFIMVTCIVLVGIMAAPVMAAAQKVNLVTCPVNYPGPTTPPGGGFVIFNNSAGPNNLEVTVSLKKVTPDTEYDIYVFVDGAWYDGVKAGTIKTNGQGNANFHMNGALAAGDHTLNLDVVLKGTFADVYETPGIHTGGGSVLTFK